MKTNNCNLTKKQSKIYGIVSMILGFVGIGAVLGGIGLWGLKIEDPIDRLNCKYGLVIGLVILAIGIAFYSAWPFLSELLSMLETA